MADTQGEPLRSPDLHRADASLIMRIYGDRDPQVDPQVGAVVEMGWLGDDTGMIL